MLNCSSFLIFSVSLSGWVLRSFPSARLQGSFCYCLSYPLTICLSLPGAFFLENLGLCINFFLWRASMRALFLSTALCHPVCPRSLSSPHRSQKALLHPTSFAVFPEIPPCPCSAPLYSSPSPRVPLHSLLLALLSPPLPTAGICLSVLEIGLCSPQSRKKQGKRSRGAVNVRVWLLAQTSTRGERSAAAPFVSPAAADQLSRTMQDPGRSQWERGCCLASFSSPMAVAGLLPCRERLRHLSP